MIGQMAVFTTLPESNDLERSVTSTFLCRNGLYLQLSPNCPKMNKKSMLKRNQYFYPRDVEACHLAAALRVKLWSLNTNLFLKEPHQLTKFI